MKDSQRTPKMIPLFGTVVVPLIGQCGPFTLLEDAAWPAPWQPMFSRENKNRETASPKFEREQNRLFCQRVSLYGFTPECNPYLCNWTYYVLIGNVELHQHILSPNVPLTNITNNNNIKCHSLSYKKP